MYSRPHIMYLTHYAELIPVKKKLIAVKMTLWPKCNSGVPSIQVFHVIVFLFKLLWLDCAMESCPFVDPAVLASIAVIDLLKKRKKKKVQYKPPRSRSTKRIRKRLSVAAIYNQLGPIYFRRAYRMKYHLSFLKLVGLVSGFRSTSGK